MDLLKAFEVFESPTSRLLRHLSCSARNGDIGSEVSRVSSILSSPMAADYISLLNSSLKKEEKRWNMNEDE